MTGFDAVLQKKRRHFATASPNIAEADSDTESVVKLDAS